MLGRSVVLSWMLCVAAWGGGDFALQDTPLRVAGIGLGTTALAVRATLGTPDLEQQSLGLRFWDYKGRGITVIWQEGDAGVRGIQLNRAVAGDVGGVKVGDSETALRKTWGSPARVRQQGRYVDFVGAEWVLSAELSQGKIAQMTLMRASAAPR